MAIAPFGKLSLVSDVNVTRRFVIAAGAKMHCSQRKDVVVINQETEKCVDCNFDVDIVCVHYLKLE